MKRLVKASVFMAVFWTASLLGSDVKLIESADAIRLIGDKRIVFVSGESNDTYRKQHIVGSVSMPAHKLYHSDEMRNLHRAPLCDSPEEAREFIRHKGIGNDQMIIAYDNFRGFKAEAVYRFFETFGHKELRVLQDGLAGIKALDPNQQVFDKLQLEQEAITRQAGTENNESDIEEKERLENQAKNIKAKMNLLEPQLLIRSGAEKKREASDYRIDIDKDQ